MPCLKVVTYESDMISPKTICVRDASNLPSNFETLKMGILAVLFLQGLLLVALAN